jgi:hypothetical protein
MRVLRMLLAFCAGVWTGLMLAAAFVKRAVPSRGDEDSDEVALVAVLDGIDMTSRARSFSGGSMLAWFGGVSVDLREAALAPGGAHLTVTAFFGGIALRTPPGWRIESTVTSRAGGVDVRSPAHDDPDAPVLHLDGRALFGGIAVAYDSGKTDPAPSA